MGLCRQADRACAPFRSAARGAQVPQPRVRQLRTTRRGGTPRRSRRLGLPAAIGLSGQDNAARLFLHLLTAREWIALASLSTAAYSPERSEKAFAGLRRIDCLRSTATLAGRDCSALAGAAGGDGGPSPEADPTPGRRWNPWETASTHEVDTAGIELLRLRGWRRRLPEMPASGGRPARLPRGCLAPLVGVAKPADAC